MAETGKDSGYVLVLDIRHEQPMGHSLGSSWFSPAVSLAAACALARAIVRIVAWTNPKLAVFPTLPLDQCHASMHADV
jgi:hypothetical protein